MTKKYFQSKGQKAGLSLNDIILAMNKLNFEELTTKQNKVTQQIKDLDKEDLEALKAENKKAIELMEQTKAKLDKDIKDGVENLPDLKDLRERLDTAKQLKKTTEKQLTQIKDKLKRLSADDSKSLDETKKEREQLMADKLKTETKLSITNSQLAFYKDVGVEQLKTVMFSIPQNPKMKIQKIKILLYRPRYRWSFAPLGPPEFFFHRVHRTSA